MTYNEFENIYNDLTDNLKVVEVTYDNLEKDIKNKENLHQ
jgi:hypothetical protein